MPEWWTGPSELDSGQREVLQNCPVNGSVVVFGAPGSGKTNLLLLRASYLAKRGRGNFAVIAFTSSLVNFIRRGADTYDVPSNNIMTFISWASTLCLQYGEVFYMEGAFEEVQAGMCSALTRAIAANGLGKLFDTILVDEAQDYRAEEIALFEVLAENLFLVADTDQSIYGKKKTERASLVAHAAAVYQLNFNYRNGAAICKFADALMKGHTDYVSMAEASNYDEGLYPSSVTVSRLNTLAQQASSAIELLKLQLEAYPGELLGLACPLREQVDELWDIVTKSDLADVAVRLSGKDHGELGGNARVVVCTFHGMKGLEFRTLHLLGAEFVANHKATQRRLLFTAVTRAKTSLAIYHWDPLPNFAQGAIGTIENHREPSLEDLFGSGSQT